ncbi:MAG: hypothetical protein AAF986_06420 [Pseudomonadota bacterium]
MVKRAVTVAMPSATNKGKATYQKTVLLAFLGLGVLGGLVMAARSLFPPTPAPTDWATEELPGHKSARWYQALGEKAALDGLWRVGLKAARHEVRTAPNDSTAWQRLALTAAEAHGNPDQESLRALLNAYEITPFPSPYQMRWRVEFAARYWPSMPDIVQEKTLTQITVLGEIGDAWPIRKAWCDGFTATALKEAACATL